jgi:NitT/TauT family transport system ATP-binding protein
MDQTSTVFPWKRTRQIIALSLARAKSRTNVRKTDVAEALAGFGLQGTGDRYPQELSGGMKQRLALAFAVLREPTLLLLDEPFGSVDEFTREGLYLLLQAALVRAPTAVVMVTHSISECLTLADRIIVLGGNPSATVAGIFTVDRPKPRSATALLEPDLVALNKEIRRKIGEL